MSSFVELYNCVNILPVVAQALLSRFYLGRLKLFEDLYDEAEVGHLSPNCPPPQFIRQH